MSMWHMDRLKTVSRPFQNLLGIAIPVFNVDRIFQCDNRLRSLQLLPFWTETISTTTPYQGSDGPWFLGAVTLLHRRKPCTCLTWVLWGAAPLPDEMTRSWDRQHVEPLSCRDKSLDTLASRKPALRTRGRQLQREVQEKKTDIAHICSLWLINLELFHVDLLWVPRNQNLLASVCSSLRHVAWMFHQSQTSATFRGQLGRKVHVVLACGDRHHVFRVTTCYACSTRS